MYKYTYTYTIKINSENAKFYVGVITKIAFHEGDVCDVYTCKAFIDKNAMDIFPVGGWIELMSEDFKIVEVDKIDKVDGVIGVVQRSAYGRPAKLGSEYTDQTRAVSKLESQLWANGWTNESELMARFKDSDIIHWKQIQTPMPQLNLTHDQRIEFIERTSKHLEGLL